jgi:8-oxo-dGTP diphosphatase
VSEGVVRVGVAVVIDGRRILVGVRGPDGPLAGYAEFPGGKCHADETPADCAIRECREETGLDVEIASSIYETVYDYPHGRIALTFLHCRPKDSAVPLIGNFRWADAGELDGLRFPEANAPVLPLVRRLIEE